MALIKRHTRMGRRDQVGSKIGTKWGENIRENQTDKLI
jgi:hypothetical protein